MNDGKCHILCKVVDILLIIGAINWGLIGISDTNLVGEIFGRSSGLSKIIYMLVGAAGVLKIIWLAKSCASCKK
jgi:uncharacterized protein